MNDNNESQIEMIDVQLLSPHPRNKEIYGQEDIKELADKIEKSGWINPLLVNQNNITISGHRRELACIYLDIKEVPIRRIKFKDENEELERLLLENEYREKTMVQKVQEGLLWEEIESKKAKERMLSGGYPMDTVPQGIKNEKGATRDIIASKISMGSGRTYTRAKTAAIEINKLRQKGKVKDAEFLTIILNDNVRGAKDIAENKIIDKIPEDIKDKVIKKELSVNKAVSQIRKDFNIITDNMKQSKKQVEEEPKIETKKCRQCEREKPITEFYEGKNICKDCHNENRNKNRNPKDVYGNEIKIDKEKIKGIDIEAIIANVKDTNKNINMIDYNAISMEFSCNIDMFIQNISKYINMADIYKLNNIDKDNKNKILQSIENIDNTMNQIKNFLI